MNPSAPGWINKFGHLVDQNNDVYNTFQDLYGGLKKSGFVYGVNIKSPRFIEAEHALSEAEHAKINLLTALYFTYKLERVTYDFTTFLDTIFAFYEELNVRQISFLNKILAGTKTSAQLEKLLDSRVYLDDNVISKTFNSIITNSLLFVDVLTFKYYLNGGIDIREHAQLLEYLAMNIISHAFNSKEINKADEKLAQLFTLSLSFLDTDQKEFDGTYREKLMSNPALWENQYLLDIACLTVWEDKTLEFHESEFIYGIGTDLGFDDKHISRSLEEITSFFSKNSEVIPFLKQDNLAMKFYDTMAKSVRRLILRNRKRLLKEISGSKELMNLISKSTVQELSPEERKRMQKQLLDIFKSIPSLAIFMLPGGAVLLPLFVKLIPQLLPSAFDDNRVEKKE
ncbi:MAG: hypothetical protein HKN89_07790 [Eudoraea sp.]|nr:hypothetical protein [Eudoraea sp.]